MSSEKELCFITWNTRGIKTKLPVVLKSLEEIGAKIAFLQETHVGPDRDDLLKMKELERKGWKVYFTVYKSAEKGVAILIRDDVPFEYICHDEDHSGGYIVLFCRLYGELFTLVNLYHHSKDRSVLYRLRDYLQETAEGVLVVGGDFNTVLDPYFDRRSMADRTDPPIPRRILEDFTASLNLRDAWAHINPTEMGYTRSEGDSRSRLDMFFMPENIIGMRVSRCKIYRQRAEKQISDHDPFALTLSVQQQSAPKIPAVASKLEDFKYEEDPDRTSEKISGAEILSAIKSLTDSGEQRPDKKTVDYYKQHRCPLTETLKIQYNSMLKDKSIPPDFNACNHSGKNCIFNVDYLIFSQILARCLMVLNDQSFSSQIRENMSINKVISFNEKTEKIKTVFLMKTIKKHKKNQEKKTQENLASSHDFSILESLLPEDSDSGEFKLLQQGCPLTNTILTLALNELKDRIIEEIIETKIMINFCRFRQALLIRTETNQDTTVINVCKQFQNDSGIKLR